MDELESFFLAPQSPRGQAGHRAVRTLRARRALKPEIDAAVAALNDLKIDKASMEKQLQAAVYGAVTREAFRQGIVNMLERHLFYTGCRRALRLQPAWLRRHSGVRLVMKLS
ncbi:hypothetical protein NL676_038111 [Syzygium grande]|nr:hypothetical protein NL676_038111 [Syzygium grande]